MAIQFSLIPIPELGTRPEHQELAAAFHRQFEEYEREIGGIDIGRHTLLTADAQLFAMTDGNALVGWTLGVQPLRKIHPEEKTFASVATYIVPSRRKTIPHRDITHALVDALKAAGFHSLLYNYTYDPELRMLLTEVGRKRLNDRVDILRARGIRENEALTANRLVLDAHGFNALMERAQAERVQRETEATRVAPPSPPKARSPAKRRPWTGLGTKLRNFIRRR